MTFTCEKMGGGVKSSVLRRVPAWVLGVVSPRRWNRRSDDRFSGAAPPASTDPLPPSDGRAEEDRGR